MQPRHQMGREKLADERGRSHTRLRKEPPNTLLPLETQGRWYSHSPLPPIGPASFLPPSQHRWDWATAFTTQCTAHIASRLRPDTGALSATRRTAAGLPLLALYRYLRRFPLTGYHLHDRARPQAWLARLAEISYLAPNASPLCVAAHPGRCKPRCGLALGHSRRQFSQLLALLGVF